MRRKGIESYLSLLKYYHANWTVLFSFPLIYLKLYISKLACRLPVAGCRLPECRSAGVPECRSTLLFQCKHNNQVVHHKITETEDREILSPLKNGNSQPFVLVIKKVRKGRVKQTNKTTAY